MNTRVQQAIERHNQGYNCAQAVACTYCDLFDIDEQTVYKMAESFGFGMGVQSVCGALTGALMLAGLKSSAGIDAPGKTKGATYQMARGMKAQFEDAAGSILCSEIKGKPDSISCEECIIRAARLVEDGFLRENKT